MVRDVRQPSLVISPLRGASHASQPQRTQPLSSSSSTRASLSILPRRTPLSEGKENKTPLPPITTNSTTTTSPPKQLSTESSVPLPRRFTALEAMASRRRRDPDETTTFAISDETMLHDVQPPSDLAGPPTSSLFGSDDRDDELQLHPRHFVGPRGLGRGGLRGIGRGRGVSGRGGLLTPEASQLQVQSASQPTPRQTAKRSAGRLPPPSEGESSVTASRPRRSIAQPSLAEIDDPTPKRQRTKRADPAPTDGSPRRLPAVPAVPKSGLKHATPAAPVARGPTRIPATAPSKAMAVRYATPVPANRRLSTPVNVTPALRARTDDWRAQLAPDKAALLPPNAFCGRLDAPIEAEPGDDPLLLEAVGARRKRKQSMPRSIKKPRTASASSRKQAKPRESEAANDTFRAQIDRRHARQEGRLEPSHPRASTVPEEEEEGGNAPANLDSPFVPRHLSLSRLAGMDTPRGNRRPSPLAQLSPLVRPSSPPRDPTPSPPRDATPTPRDLIPREDEHEHEDEAEGVNFGDEYAYDDFAPDPPSDNVSERELTPGPERFESLASLSPSPTPRRLSGVASGLSSQPSSSRVPALTPPRHSPRRATPPVEEPVEERGEERGEEEEEIDPEGDTIITDHEVAEEDEATKDEKLDPEDDTVLHDTEGLPEPVAEEHEEEFNAEGDTLPHDSVNLIGLTSLPVEEDEPPVVQASSPPPPEEAQEDVDPEGDTLLLDDEALPPSPPHVARPSPPASPPAELDDTAIAELVEESLESIEAPSLAGDTPLAEVVAALKRAQRMGAPSSDLPPERVDEEEEAQAEDGAEGEEGEEGVIDSSGDQLQPSPRRSSPPADTSPRQQPVESRSPSPPPDYERLARQHRIRESVLGRRISTPPPQTALSTQVSPAISPALSQVLQREAAPAPPVAPLPPPHPRSHARRSLEDPEVDLDLPARHRRRKFAGITPAKPRLSGSQGDIVILPSPKASRHEVGVEPSPLAAPSPYLSSRSSFHENAEAAPTSRPSPSHTHSLSYDRGNGKDRAELHEAQDDDEGRSMSPASSPARVLTYGDEADALEKRPRSPSASTAPSMGVRGRSTPATSGGGTPFYDASSPGSTPPAHSSPNLAASPFAPRSPAKVAPRASSRAFSRAPSRTPPLAPSSDASGGDLTIDADDTLEGVSDVWGNDTLDITQDESMGGYKYDGPAWDVTRIESQREREVSVSSATRSRHGSEARSVRELSVAESGHSIRPIWESGSRSCSREPSAAPSNHSEREMPGPTSILVRRTPAPPVLRLTPAPESPEASTTAAYSARRVPSVSPGLEITPTQPRLGLHSRASSVTSDREREHLSPTPTPQQQVAPRDRPRASSAAEESTPTTHHALPPTSPLSNAGPSAPAQSPRPRSPWLQAELAGRAPEERTPLQRAPVYAASPGASPRLRLSSVGSPTIPAELQPSPRLDPNQRYVQSSSVVSGAELAPDITPRPQARTHRSSSLAEEPHNPRDERASSIASEVDPAQPQLRSSSGVTTTFHALSVTSEPEPLLGPVQPSPRRAASRSRASSIASQVEHLAPAQIASPRRSPRLSRASSVVSEAEHLAPPAPPSPSPRRSPRLSRSHSVVSEHEEPTPRASPQALEEPPAEPSIPSHEIEDEAVPAEEEHSLELSEQPALHQQHGQHDGEKDEQDATSGPSRRSPRRPRPRGEREHTDFSGSPSPTAVRFKVREHVVHVVKDESDDEREVIEVEDSRDDEMFVAHSQSDLEDEVEGGDESAKFPGAHINAPANQSVDEDEEQNNARSDWDGDARGDESYEHLEANGNEDEHDSIEEVERERSLTPAIHALTPSPPPTPRAPAEGQSEQNTPRAGMFSVPGGRSVSPATRAPSLHRSPAQHMRSTSIHHSPAPHQPSPGLSPASRHSPAPSPAPAHARSPLVEAEARQTLAPPSPAPVPTTPITLSFQLSAQITSPRPEDDLSALGLFAVETAASLVNAVDASRLAASPVPPALPSTTPRAPPPPPPAFSAPTFAAPTLTAPARPRPDTVPHIAAPAFTAQSTTPLAPPPRRPISTTPAGPPPRLAYQGQTEAGPGPSTAQSRFASSSRERFVPQPQDTSYTPQERYISQERRPIGSRPAVPSALSKQVMPSSSAESTPQHPEPRQSRPQRAESVHSVHSQRSLHDELEESGYDERSRYHEHEEEEGVRRSHSAQTDMSERYARYEAEIGLARGRREHTPRQPQFNSPGAFDSPGPAVPGAWSRTSRATPNPQANSNARPTSPRTLYRSTRNHSRHPRAWTNSDWRRLQSFYDAERARAATWTPFRRQTHWSVERVVESFIKRLLLEQVELVGEWSVEDLEMRVRALDNAAEYRERSMIERSVRKSQRARELRESRASQAQAQAAPSTLRRVVDWAFGRSIAPTSQPTPAPLQVPDRGREPSSAHGHEDNDDEAESRASDLESEHEPRRQHRRANDPELGFLRRVDESFDPDVTMAQTPSRPVTHDRRVERLDRPVGRGHREPERRQQRQGRRDRAGRCNEDLREQDTHHPAERQRSQLPNIERAVEHHRPLRRSPSARALESLPERRSRRRSPSPSRSPSPQPTEITDEDYRYNDASRSLYNLYPSLPDRSAALAQSIAPAPRIVEGSPRPQPRPRSTSTAVHSTASPLRALRQSLSQSQRHQAARPTITQAAGAFTAHASAHLSWESERRVRERASIEGLRRVQSEIARVRALGHDVSDESFESFRAFNDELNASVRALGRRNVSG